MANLGSLLLQRFADFADRSAANDSGGTMSYRQLAAAATAVDWTLRSAGLTPDEPVMVPVANEPRDAAALVGVWLAGGVAVPIARHAPASATDVRLTVTGARFSITNAADELVAKLKEEAPPIVRSSTARRLSYLRLDRPGSQKA